jgi:4-diphosphocytidyl-2-C-methyl-D-erythritol kinase
MAKTEINTPAKINIGLYVIDKRQDGYHNIETIFYPIRLYDRLSIEDSVRFQFTSNVESLPGDSTNLVILAKHLLEEYSGERLNFKIYLEKNIPIGAGLGGGSSDAAASLTALNEFAGLNLSQNELYDLALRLGSDVPFFLKPQPCFADGRGENLYPKALNSELPVVVVYPGINVSTGWAYSRIKPDKADFNLKEVESLDLPRLIDYRSRIKNVFEKPVFEKYPVIEEIKLLHYKMGAALSLMSGSGSTVFGIYPDSESANYAGKIMKDKGHFVFIQT